MFGLVGLGVQVLTSLNPISMADSASISLNELNPALYSPRALRGSAVGSYKWSDAVTTSKWREQLDRLVGMPASWDGYGAYRISAKTADNVSRILKTILGSAPEPDLIPNTNGTISLEWASNLGEAVIEVGVDRFSFYITSSSGNPQRDGSVDEFNGEIGAEIALYLYPQVYRVETLTHIDFTPRVFAAA